MAPPTHSHADAGAPEESNRDPKRETGKGKSHPSGTGESWETSIAPVLAPGLYITATPIGNAADITLRALTVLKHCDAIVAEDTRVTSRLLSLYGISRPLFVYNDHNAASMRPKLLSKLRTGARLALVSDAGTPLISDPGHKLVREALEEELPVFPIPGASAVLAGLVCAGLATDRFFFAGFLPSKAGERRSRIAGLKAISATLVFYESAQRLGESLADMTEILGSRDAAVARELTKLHEEVRRGTLGELASHYAGPPPKGEIVLLVGPPAEADAPDSTRIDALLTEALGFMPVKSAASLIAEATGIGRRAVYARALALKGLNRADDDEEA
ncbi:MAG TPA: 16S rRNA (cytidine(1402)-2'-O)-methyltransferase [Micropepsaceae bacterium]